MPFCVEVMATFCRAFLFWILNALVALKVKTILPDAQNAGQLECLPHVKDSNWGGSWSTVWIRILPCMSIVSVSFSVSFSFSFSVSFSVSVSVSFTVSFYTHVHASAMDRQKTKRKKRKFGPHKYIHTRISARRLVLQRKSTCIAQRRHTRIPTHTHAGARTDIHMTNLLLRALCSLCGLLLRESTTAHGPAYIR